MIRACACGAKLFAALEYEQPGRLRPAGSRLQFSANKKTARKAAFFVGGDDQTRTDYLYVANVSLYRVSYIPEMLLVQRTISV